MSSGNGQDDSLTAFQERILDELMEAQRPLSKTALMNAMGKDCRGLITSLGALEARGYVQSAEANGEKWWMVTEAGEAAAIAPNPAVWRK